MATDSEKTLRSTLVECTEKVRSSKAKAEPVVVQIRSGNLDKDYLVKIVDFLNGFDEVRQCLDTIPVTDGKFPDDMSPDDRRAVSELMPPLIEEIEGMAEYQVLLTETLRKGMETNKENMKKVRDAKKMFDKFVKKPEGGPRFFDREG